MKINTKSSLSRRAKIIIIASIVGVLLLGGGVYATYVALNPPASTDTTSDSSEKDQNKVDYDAPSSEQQQTGSDIKDEAVNNANSPKTDTEVIITFAGQVTNTVKVRSYMNALQSSGECTITLSMGSSVITKKGTIQPSANISACEEVTVPISEFSNGTWDVTVNYNGETKKGTASATFKVEK